MPIYLLTGGAGSLGRKLAKELLKPKYEAQAIRILDNHENSLVNLERELKDPRLRFLLGNIKEKDRMIRAMENIDVAILTAAQKHVHLAEYNPFFCIETNVLGTQVCIDAALERNVDKVIFLSSDKAVFPYNVYGKCKSLSESLVLDAMNYRGDRRTKLSVFRPPNFIASDGSVWDVWNYEKEKGFPLSVTDEKMERFFMDFDQIVYFIMRCVDVMEGGEIFVPIGAEKLKIIDLAKEISDNIKITGLRKGERLTEYLYTEEEIARAEQKEGMWVIT